MVVQAQRDLPFPKKLGYRLKILDTRSKREYVQVLRPLERFPFGGLRSLCARPSCWGRYASENSEAARADSKHH